MMLPVLYSDDDAVIVDEPRCDTRIYDLTLKVPAAPLAERFPVASACLADLGVPTDLIATSIAAGCRWRVGPADQAESHTVIWLLALDVPYGRQVAAWWVGGPE